MSNTALGDEIVTALRNGWLSWTKAHSDNVDLGLVMSAFATFYVECIHNISLLTGISREELTQFLTSEINARVSEGGHSARSN